MEFIDSVRDVLSDLEKYKKEYQDACVDGRTDWQYFKGKADAYNHAAKHLKRCFDWHDIPTGKEKTQ